MLAGYNLLGAILENELAGRKSAEAVCSADISGHVMVRGEEVQTMTGIH